MGWGIDFKADIYLSKQDYQGNKYNVAEAIDELLDSISENQK